MKMCSIKSRLKKITFIYRMRYFLSAYRAPIRIILQSRISLRKYKNKYKDKRCFIIGNGPSLKAEDLDKLEGEITFAANSIYKIFPSTKWRPTFYCVQDERVVAERDLNCLSSCLPVCDSSFIRMHAYHKIKEQLKGKKKPIFVPVWSGYCTKEGVPFSMNKNIFFDGGTVTYLSLQLAVYMGFKDIFLIGCDNQMPFLWNGIDNPEVVDLSLASHFYDGAENNKSKDAHISRGADFREITNAYQNAEKSSRKYGSFRIYNATRGGALEVFERINFDLIVGEK